MGLSFLQWRGIIGWSGMTWKSKIMTFCVYQHFFWGSILKTFPLTADITNCSMLWAVKRSLHPKHLNSLKLWIFFKLTCQWLCIPYNIRIHSHMILRDSKAFATFVSRKPEEQRKQILNHFKLPGCGRSLKEQCNAHQRNTDCPQKSYLSNAPWRLYRRDDSSPTNDVVMKVTQRTQ